VESIAESSAIKQFQHFYDAYPVGGYAMDSHLEYFMGKGKQFIVV
jgi:TolA-binding protein